MEAQPQPTPTDSNRTEREHPVNRQLQAVLDAASETAIIATDPAGLITIFNRGAENMLGYPTAEMVGRQTPLLLHLASEVEQYGSVLSRRMGREIGGFGVFAESALLSGVEKRDWTYVRKDGSQLPVSLTVTVIRDDRGAAAGFLFIAEDLTERRAAEREREKLTRDRLHAHRMESVGRLASGVSHDLNNLLTPILGYAEMLRKACAADERLLKRVHGILEAAGQARDLNRHLLAFSRKQVLEMKSIDLNQVISSFADQLEQTIRRDITISLKLDPRLGSILADRAQVEQIIMNLCLNAQDAMPHGGSLVIETSNLLPAPSWESASELKPGSYVVLSVTDSGLGMTPNIMEQIFEPFFTTKASGKGAGLGLATVFGIARQHDGHIHAASEPGHGSTFTVNFPRLDDPESAEARPSRERGGEPGRSRTILLVEDTPLVREMTCELLTEQGYCVLAAADAQEATALMVKHSRHVDLLLTDIILPGKSGTALYETIKPLCPDLKVIFMSGYNDPVGDRQDGRHYIHKPFTHDAILNKIDDVIGNQRS